MNLEARKTILIVDDEKAYCEAIAEILVHMGFSVALSYSAEEAVRSLERMIPDVMLIDIMMPEVDGLSLLRQIKTNTSLLGTPFVVVSAKVMPADRAAAWIAGADAFLPKPFTMDELIEIIEYVSPVESEHHGVEQIQHKSGLLSDHRATKQGDLDVEGDPRRDTRPLQESAMA